MKKWFTILLFSGMFLSCGNAQIKTEIGDNLSPEQRGVKSETVIMTKAEFLKKVADFEGNPNEWRYLGDKPAIVDFYANWCGPCRAISPILEELATEYKDEIYVYKVDTDREHDLSVALGIVSLPTLLFIPMEGQPRMVTGALPKEKFKEIINQYLLKK